MQSSETNIIAGFNQASPSAFKEIFELYYSRVRYFAFKLIGNREDAEDITLESFSKLFERYKDFNNEASIRAFLFIATRNACFNLLKYQQKTQTGQKELLYLQQEGLPDPELVETELLNMIYRAIESLPSERKKVFKMLYLQGMKLAEVAEQLNISIHTVKSHRAKAIAALRAILSGSTLFMAALVWVAAGSK